MQIALVFVRNRLQPATCNTLAALMRSHPHPVKQIDLLTDVVRFARDAHSDAVYSRIYEVKQVLSEGGADIVVRKQGAAGYGISTLLSTASTGDAEREREREREREKRARQEKNQKKGN